MIDYFLVIKGLVFEFFLVEVIFIINFFKLGE